MYSRRLFDLLKISAETSTIFKFRPPHIRQKLSINCRRYNSSDPNQLPKPKVLSQSKIAPVNWKTFAISAGLGGCVLGYLYYLKSKKDFEKELNRKRQIGKSLIGGSWELVNTDGKLMSSDDFLGKWVLIYFGFTHCPDICPDELEKMAETLKKLDEDKKKDFEVVGLFMTVDPERDTPEKIRKYLNEFSPNIMGFTGTREQINKVCKTFRVYHSEGPKDVLADYIVDHTIITHLVDPDGNFVDFYGQKRSANEIIDAIRMHQAKRKAMERKAKIFFNAKAKQLVTMPTQQPTQQQ